MNRVRILVLVLIVAGELVTVTVTKGDERIELGGDALKAGDYFSSP